MGKALDFYFDFASPYAYLASHRIEGIAIKHGRVVAWRPILLGAVFKVSGQKPLLDVPLLRDYTRVDIMRCAREFDIPFSLPSIFPVATVNAARSIYWVQQEHPALATPLVHALFEAYFAEDKNISEVENVLAVATDLGINSEQLASGLQEPAIKGQLKDAVDSAIANSIFGSPCSIVDGEQFWGNDRLDQLDKWLAKGGW